MIRVFVKKFLSLFEYKKESLKKCKHKWDKLSREDAKYYIWSNNRNQTDEEFRDSGKQDYENLIIKDPFLQEHLSQIFAKTMLEIGCGIGRMTEFFAQDFQSVKAIDISSEMINFAKIRLGYIQHIDFIETDGSTIPLPNNSIDFAFSFIVFQHITSCKIIEQYFYEINRVLNKKGIAKVQIRGLEIPEKDKGKWYYGVHYDLTAAHELIKTTGFQLLKHDGEGERYFWLWLKKI